jgi:hypothetical protein
VSWLNPYCKTSLKGITIVKANAAIAEKFDVKNNDCDIIVTRLELLRIKEDILNWPYAFYVYSNILKKPTEVHTAK